jgi:lipopolysaccharide transport system permease protein
MLVVYAFVFGVVFQARWNIGETSTAGSGEYALVMFVGLIVYGIFAEPILRSTGVIVGHPNYVKKVVFPLQIFPVMLVLSSLFHSMISIFIWCVFHLIFLGTPPVTGFLYPLVILPLVMLATGLALMFAALGVYLRDLAQVLGVVVPAIMFLSPIFYPRSALPEFAQNVLPYVNPVAIPIEEARRVMIAGELPLWGALGGYALAALVVLLIGNAVFNGLRKGFSDVL